MTIGKIAKLMLLSALFLIPFASMADRTEKEKLTVSNDLIVTGTGTFASVQIGTTNSPVISGITNVNSGGTAVGYNAMLAGSSVGSTTLKTNTVSFASAFGYTPYVIVGWMDSTLNQVATPQVISRSSSNFSWVIRNSEGMISTNWTINWIATDTQILSSSNLISLQNFTSDRVPIGSIEMWGSLTAPNGWFLCDGSAVSRSTYSNLFSVISTNFGVGDGSTTFTLPDLRNRFAYGVSTGLGMTGGVSSVTLTSNQIPAHIHATMADSGIYSLGGGVGHAGWGLNGAASAEWAELSARVSSSSGGGQAHTNMPPYQSVSFIIKHSDVLQTTAQEALPISGTIPMSGTLTVPSITITNGATSNAVFVSTNSLGQGKWVPRRSFAAKKETLWSIPSATVTNMACSLVDHNDGNLYSTATGNYTPDTPGIYEFHAFARVVANSGGGTYTIIYEAHAGATNQITPVSYIPAASAGYGYDMEQKRRFYVPATGEWYYATVYFAASTGTVSAAIFDGALQR